MISVTYLPRPFDFGAREEYLTEGARTVREAMPGALRGREDVIAWRNSRRVHLDEPVDEGDALAFAPAPGFEGITAGVITDALLNIFIAAAVSYVATLLFPPPGPPKDRGDEESPSYGFSGISNTRVEGLPIPVTFGRFRMGGQVVAEYTLTRSIPSTTDLFILLAFGEGPFRAFGNRSSDTSTWVDSRATGFPSGVLVEGNPAPNYPGLEAQVRMGTLEQLPIEGFHQVPQTSAVAFTLEADPTDLRTNDVLMFSSFFDTSGDAFWASYGRAFDITTAVDAVSVRIAFAQGLFYSESDGDIRGSNFVFQVRYRELDASNNPITSGGINGDGYVRLPPVQLLSIIQRGPFDFEHKFDLIDKSDYVPPTTGEALDLDGVDDFASAGANGNNPFVTGTAVEEISIATWIKADAGEFPTSGNTGQFLHVMGNYNATTKRGFSLGFRSRANILGLFWVPAVYWGDDTDENFQQADADWKAEEERWHHVAFTYHRDFDGAQSRFRVYLDGDMAFEHVTSGADIVWATTRGFYFGRNPDHNGTVYFATLIDDALVWTRELTQSDIKAQYASGNGVYGSGDADLHGWWDWNQAGATQQASDPYYLDASLSGGATSGATAGLLATAPSGSPLRSKVRVEVLRINVDSQNAQSFDDAEWVSITGYTSEELSHSLVPLLALHIPANDTLNTTRPRVTALVDASRCPVWDGVDEQFPTITDEWSANPAWISLAILTNTRWGLGRYYTVTDVDLAALKSWADHCDEVLWDGTQDWTAGPTEPIADFYFFNDVTDSTGTTRGAIVIAWTVSPQTMEPPASFVPGSFVILSNVPQNGANPSVNNSDGISGYEIKENVFGFLQFGIQAWVTVIYWDRLDEGEPWTHGNSLFGDEGETPSGRATGGLHRYEFNGTFDTSRSAWDALLDVAKVGRAVPIREGNKIRFRFAHERQPVGMIGMGAIERGSFVMRYRGGKSAPNAYDVGFLDREHDFDRSYALGLHDSVESEASLEALRKEQTFIPGITHRAQAMRQAKFLANMQQDLVRTGEFKMQQDALQYEPGDLVRLAHDIVPRGVSGRNQEAVGDDRVRSDRAFTIDGFENYTLYVMRPDTDVLEGVAVNKTATGNGAHDPGDLIITQSDFTFTIPEGAPFLLCQNGEELVVEIAKITLDHDLTRRVEFVEYQASIFDDEFDDVLTDEGLLTVDDGLGEGGLAENRIPENPTITGTDDTIIKRRGGTFEPVLRVSWKHERDTLPYVARTNVYLSRNGASWMPVGSAEGRASFLEIPLAAAEAGDLVRVAVQPVTQKGRSLPPPHCATALHRIVGIGAYPEPPENVSAEMVDDKVVYTWALPAGQEGNVVECRRGGWILAPVVFVSERGATSFGPTRDWAGASAGTPRLFFRCRNEIGQYSEQVELAFTPGPRVEASELQMVFADQAWESYGDGWVFDTPTFGNATLSGLVRHADGYVEFDGSSLTGTYTIADTENPAPIDMRVPRRCFLEATLQAEQIHPLTWDMADIPWGDEKFLRWTWEGPTHVLPGETANCTVKIEVRVNTSGVVGDWSAWREYRPGVVGVASAMFRVTFTRPSTAYQIRMHSFRTRVRGVGLTLSDRTPAQAFLEHEVFG